MNNAISILDNDTYSTGTFPKNTNDISIKCVVACVFNNVIANVE